MALEELMAADAAANAKGEQALGALAPREALGQPTTDRTLEPRTHAAGDARGNAEDKRRAEGVEGGPLARTDRTQENPYLLARRSWNDHVARLVAARTMWQLVGLLSLLLSLCATGALIHFASLSRFVPYVVQVDRLGAASAVGPGLPMPPASRAVIEAQLEKFVTLSRRVTTDIGLQRAAIFGLYAMLTPDDPATAKMTDHLNGSPHKTPFARAQRETVSTEITSVLQQSPDSWQVDWTESVYEQPSGKRKERFEMRALVQVYQTAPREMTDEALRTNPLGVYVRDFNWNRKQPREVPQ